MKSKFVRVSHSVEMVSVLGFGLMALSGCWGVAAGAGAEAAYVTTQENRTAGETFDDQRITAEIKTRLLADPDVSGLKINVDTFKKAVTLKGFVSSGFEAERALTIARGVSGVTSVQSSLVIDTKQTHSG